MNKASFSARVVAFLIDIILVALITSLVTFAIPTSKNVVKLSQEQTEIIDQYTNGEIDTNTYISQLLDLNYDLTKQTSLFSIISIFVAILYFCVLPFYYNGQTIGKKWLRIKIQKKDHSKLTMNDLVIRSSLIDFIFLHILTTALVLIAAKDVYLWGSTILESIQYLFVIISVFMIAFSKPKDGLHDKLVKTEVVRVNNTVKELEEAKCEN